MYIKLFTQSAVLGVLRELNGFPAIVFFGACILGTVSFIFLIVFSIIIGVQEGRFLLSECCLKLSFCRHMQCGLDQST